MRSYGYVPQTDQQREALARVQNNPTLSDDKKEEIIRGWVEFDRRKWQGLNRWKNRETIQAVQPIPAPYNFVDSREMRASVNHLERRIYNLERKNNGLRTNGARA